jgi:DNA invertase Pin-like site-specific DNA recombinase
MLGVFAEFETNLRRERQLEGIADAKARGVYKGRKQNLDGTMVPRNSVASRLLD